MENARLYRPDPEEAFRRLDEARARGEIRERISCDEFQTAYFAMAQRMYVENGEPEPRDYEVGVHLAQCSAEPCRILGRAYFAILRNSSPDDGPDIAVQLEELRARIDALKN